MLLRRVWDVLCDLFDCNAQQCVTKNGNFSENCHHIFVPFTFVTSKSAPSLLFAAQRAQWKARKPSFRSFYHFLQFLSDMKRSARLSITPHNIGRLSEPINTGNPTKEPKASTDLSVITPHLHARADYIAPRPAFFASIANCGTCPLPLSTR